MGFRVPQKATSVEGLNPLTPLDPPLHPHPPACPPPPYPTRTPTELNVVLVLLCPKSTKLSPMSAIRTQRAIYSGHYILQPIISPVWEAVHYYRHYHRDSNNISRKINTPSEAGCVNGRLLLLTPCHSYTIRR